MTTKTQKRRSTEDLIHELDTERTKFFFVAVAVGFEKTTTFVPASAPDRLMKLNAALIGGGEPIAMVGVVKHDDHRMTLYTRPLKEYANDERAQEYLATLTETIATLFKIDVANVQTSSGWFTYTLEDMDAEKQQLETYKAVTLTPHDLLDLDPDDQFCRPYANEIDPIVATINTIIESKLDDYFSDHPVNNGQ
jgi:hypothetical protein